VELPWIALGRLMLGLHETRDKAALMEFLKSDGAALGDPAVFPWCGDFVETCIKRTLPEEAFPGDLGKNRYWARNWALLGKAVAPTYGAILVFSRPGGGGHVGFCLGQDGDNFVVLGGNQSNAVNVAKYSAAGLLGIRRAADAKAPAKPKSAPPVVDAATAAPTPAPAPQGFWAALFAAIFGGRK
jgi:uncharacterized protein (TIGR02594 family)